MRCREAVLVVCRCVSSRALRPLPTFQQAHSLTRPRTGKTPRQEISKSNVVDDMVASNRLLYEEDEHPDHVVVIKCVLWLIGWLAGWLPSGLLGPTLQCYPLYLLYDCLLLP